MLIGIRGKNAPLFDKRFVPCEMFPIEQRKGKVNLALHSITSRLQLEIAAEVDVSSREGDGPSVEAVNHVLGVGVRTDVRGELGRQDEGEHLGVEPVVQLEEPVQLRHPRQTTCLYQTKDVYIV